MKSIIKNIGKFLIIMLYHPEIIGLENIPNEGPAILAGKHNHSFDPVFIITLLDRDACFAAKKELWDNKLLAKLLDLFNAVKINRKSADLKENIVAFKEMSNILKMKKLLGIFVEGTRGGFEKGLDPKKGAAYLAIKNDVPIIPFWVMNIKIFGKTKILIGNGFSLNGDIDEGIKKIMDSIISLKEIKDSTNQKKLVVL